jgi:lipoprotein NlpI
LMALKIQPDHAQAHNNIGIILARAGKIDEAVVHFQKALQIDPKYTDARLNLQSIVKKAKKTIY